MPYYAGMTTIGSLIGCYLLYGVARRGGEVFLRKRLKGRYVDRAITLYQRHGLMAVVVPALLPPPVPFKVFVLLAGAAVVSPVRFGIAVLIGRGIRYFGQGYLAVLYGEYAAEFMRSHGTAVGIGLGVAAILIGVLVVYVRRRQHGSAAA
jgi:membrane protein DedA with SNARE-associated domain